MGPSEHGEEITGITLFITVKKSSKTLNRMISMQSLQRKKKCSREGQWGFHHRTAPQTIFCWLAICLSCKVWTQASLCPNQTLKCQVVQLHKAPLMWWQLDMRNTLHHMWQQRTVVRLPPIQVFVSAPNTWFDEYQPSHLVSKQSRSLCTRTHTCKYTLYSRPLLNMQYIAPALVRHAKCWCQKRKRKKFRLMPNQAKKEKERKKERKSDRGATRDIQLGAVLGMDRSKNFQIS